MSAFGAPCMPLSASPTFCNGEGRTPLVSQDIKTDTAIGVDVGMVNAGGEVDFWWLEGIIGRELNGKEEDATLEGAVARSHDCSLPVKLP